MLRRIIFSVIGYVYNYLGPRRYIFIIFDICLCYITLWLSFFLRMDRFYSINEIPLYPVVISLILLTGLIYIFQVHKSINRYSGLETFIQLTKVLLLYSLIFSFIFTLNSFENVPRTIGIIQPILLSFSILSSRALIKYIFLKFLNNTHKKFQTKNCLIYGAGNSGRQLATIIDGNNELNCIGFLDDDVSLQGTKINNRTIYNSYELKQLKKRYNIELVFLAISALKIHNKIKILSSIQILDIPIRSIPNLNELTSGNISTSNIGNLNIDELLGRASINLKSLTPNINIKNKNIIITGGGGSIGSEICRQISQLSPKTIIIVELNEFSLYSIQQEIESFNFAKKVKIIPSLVSILDKSSMEKIFKKYKPDTIFHAAAYKHVKIVEENPITGIRNNVFGTLKLAELSLKYNLSNFILISTDKAVRPTNVMGASKRLSELIIQAFQNKSKNTIFCIVRFGNVLGSSGSVVPKFMKQIKSGGPLTLTHPKVTRFFMTINEAVSLVIKSSMISKGGEVFVLNMGDPIRIIDLARKMIELSGKTIKDKNNLNGDVEIKLIGLSRGEKLYEELLIGNSPIKTEQDKIFIAQEKFVEWKHLKLHLKNLNSALSVGNIKLVKNLFVNIGTSYKS